MVGVNAPKVTLWRELDSETVHIGLQFRGGHYSRIVLDEVSYIALAAAVMRDLAASPAALAGDTHVTSHRIEREVSA